MKKELKNSKGITLIALVVTIIVLIILAGVSINLILGDNGIIQKAREAKTETEQARVNEEVATNELMEQWDDIVGGETPTTPTEPETPVEYAPYDNPYIPAGFTHIGTENWNNGYTIQDLLGNEFVWVPCVLDQAKVKPGDTVETFKKTTEGKYNSLSLGLSPTDTSVTDADPTEAIRTSVGTYGGFYIAKYEAGIEGTTENNSLTTKTATDGSVKPLSQAGKGLWNSITRTDAITVAESMVNTTDGVKSGLISGECWDTTLQWMVNTSENAANEPNAGYDIDSTGNGVYGQSTKELTGQYEVNNIYDMAGNVWEWTTENCTVAASSYLVIRGGYCVFSGSEGPAAHRYTSNGNISGNVGFRVVLYK